MVVSADVKPVWIGRRLDGSGGVDGEEMTSKRQAERPVAQELRVSSEKESAFESALQQDVQGQAVACGKPCMQEEPHPVHESQPVGIGRAALFVAVAVDEWRPLCCASGVRHVAGIMRAGLSSARVESSSIFYSARQNNHAPMSKRHQLTTKHREEKKKIVSVPRFVRTDAQRGPWFVSGVRGRHTCLGRR